MFIFIILSIAGADPGSSFRGGGAKYVVRASTSRARNLGKEPSRGFSVTLSRAILALFLNILIQYGIKQKHSRSKFRGTPLDPPWYIILTSLFNVAIAYC